MSTGYVARHVYLMRAIGAEFLLRKYLPLVIIFGASVVVAIAIVVWLATINLWWLLLLVPVIILAVIGAVLAIVFRILLATVRPELTKTQKKSIAGFVDKLERVTGTIHVPMYLIIFRVARDVVIPRKQTYIGSVVDDSTTLHKDYLELARSFDQ